MFALYSLERDTRGTEVKEAAMNIAHKRMANRRKFMNLTSWIIVLVRNIKFFNLPLTLYNQFVVIVLFRLCHQSSFVSFQNIFLFYASSTSGTNFVVDYALYIRADCNLVSNSDCR